MLVRVLLSTPDMLLNVVLHGASALVVEESTTTHLHEHVVSLMLEKH